ncbi:ROK family protein [Deinococcus rubellus]|uniref:ROK family protein n=1 Tax=Deinococcus rubellus TaxID=1889240 RepID=UPI0031E659EA
MSSFTLALDIGGTHITAALIGPQGIWPGSSVRAPITEAWPAERILETWAQTALTAACAGPACQQIVASMPGPFDYQHGVALFNQKMLALTDLNIHQQLRQRWTGTPLEGLPLTFINDAAAFALGELYYGQGRGVGRLLGVTLGTGFGSGFLVNGQVITSGPEVPAGGTIWQLPLRGGVAEDFVSGAWVQRHYADLTGRRCDVQQIAEHAQQGEAAALQVFRQFGQDIGEALATCVQHFKPDLIVVGGQISRAWPLFGGPAQQRLLPFKLARSDLLDHANLLGAAHAAARRSQAAPPDLPGLQPARVHSPSTPLPDGGSYE